MKTRWVLAATVLGAMAGVAACAAGAAGNKGTTMGTGGAQASTTQSSTASSSQASSSGTGGMGTGGASSANGTGGSFGVGGFGGASSTGSSSSSASSSSSTSGACGMPEPLCGNGMIDPGEDCDGTNLNGKTCADVGPFGSGTLACNKCCHFIVQHCKPLENCTNGTDDNGNGLVDCQDPECTGKTGCVDSCMPTYPATLGSNSGDTTGRTHTHDASCSSSMPGNEQIFQITPTKSGTLALTLVNNSGGSKFSVSIRTSCEMDDSEIVCSNTVNAAGNIRVGATVTAGQTYYLMVQGMTSTDKGAFSLVVTMPPPESLCSDLKDNDGNGYTDCDDPSCQSMPACVPGTGATGTPCAANTDCNATANNPVCLHTVAFPGGYCSQWCNAANPCPSGAVCYTQLDLSKDGVCLQGCTQSSDCNTAAGYACVGIGGGTNACMLAETQCNDYIDNNFNNLIDCQDPECQTDPACTPGTGAIGTPCTLNNQCVSSTTVNDPLCLDQVNNMYPSGYCSHWCDPTVANDCGPLAICVPEGPNSGNVCMSVCLTNAQCRPDYTCQNLGFAQKICHF